VISREGPCCYADEVNTLTAENEAIQTERDQYKEDAHKLEREVEALRGSCDAYGEAIKGWRRDRDEIAGRVFSTEIELAAAREAFRVQTEQINDLLTAADARQELIDNLESAPSAYSDRSLRLIEERDAAIARAEKAEERLDEIQQGYRKPTAESALRSALRVIEGLRVRKCHERWPALDAPSRHAIAKIKALGVRS